MLDELEARSRQRRVILMVMASIFLVWQVPSMDVFDGFADDDRRLGGLLPAAGFVIWALALIVVLATGKGLTRNVRPEIRAALEDEFVKHNRSKAFAIGYVVALATSGLMFGCSLFLPVSGTDAAHLMLVAAVVAPMYAFAFLERVNA